MPQISKKIQYSPIGLDISSKKIRLMQLKKQYESYSIYQASVDKESISQDDDILKNQLRDLLADANLKGKKTVVALPSNIVTTLPFKFNQKNDEGIEEAIIREVPNYLSYPLEDAIIDYINLPTLDMQSQKNAILIAAKRVDILKYLNILMKNKLDPIAIEPRYCSLFRTIKWAKADVLENQFIFYIEDDKTIIMIVFDGQPLLVREIAWGTGLIKNKLKESLELNDKTIERVISQYGLDFGNLLEGNQDNIDFLNPKELNQIVYEVVNPILNELCQEIQKVVSYFVSITKQHLIEKAIVLGNVQEIKSFANFIQQKIGIQINTLDNIEKIELFLKPYPLFEMAFGLAIRN